jgi:hypothetical protein
MYVFYVKKVFHGIDVTKTTEIGVVLTPEKNISYENLFGLSLTDPSIIKQNEKQLFSHYNFCSLEKYRADRKVTTGTLLTLIPQ